MKKYIKSARIDEDVYDDCFEEAKDYIIEGMEDGEYWSYDDVVSDVYAEIQDYFDNIGSPLADDVEDELYEAIMNMLDDEGYIDHKRGLLLYGN